MTAPTTVPAGVGILDPPPTPARKRATRGVLDALADLVDAPGQSKTPAQSGIGLSIALLFVLGLPTGGAGALLATTTAATLGFCVAVTVIGALPPPLGWRHRPPAAHRTGPVPAATTPAVGLSPHVASPAAGPTRTTRSDPLLPTPVIPERGCSSCPQSSS